MLALGQGYQHRCFPVRIVHHETRQVEDLQERHTRVEYAAEPLTRTVNVIPSAGSGGSGGGGAMGYFIVLMLVLAIIMSGRGLRAFVVSANKGARR